MNNVEINNNNDIKISKIIKMERYIQSKLFLVYFLDLLLGEFMIIS